MKGHFQGKIQLEESFKYCKSRGLDFNDFPMLRSGAMPNIVELYADESLESRNTRYKYYLIMFLHEEDLFQRFEENLKLLQAIKEYLLKHPFPKDTTWEEQFKVIIQDLVR
jgi:hypothetical protein